MFLLLSGLIFITSCKNSQISKDDSARQEAFKEYIYAYTANAISKTANIKVRFTTPLVPAEYIGEPAENKLLKVSPSVPGTTRWEDRQTLVFLPETSFESGKEYSVAVQLDRLFEEVPKGLRSFSFPVKIRDLFLDLELEGLRAEDPADLSRQMLTGRVTTSDVVELEEIKQVVSASQKNSRLDLNWEQSPDQMVHHFTIQGVSRGESPSEVSVEWNGRSLGIEREGKESWPVPSLSDFKVIDAQAILGIEEQYIQLQFSDPLSNPQELNGLIELKGFAGNLRYLIDGNRLRVYPSFRLSGAYELVVHEGVQNSAGTTLPNTNQWKLQFDEVKPALRLVGDGVILPDSKGLLFPFEAIGLRYVEVEIRKIFDNNILQFLQVNSLDGNYEMERVGEVILQKRVALNSLNSDADNYRWTHYALDLSTLIDKDPYAIYQIAVGFLPGYGLYPCDENNPWIPSEEELAMAPTENKDEFQSIWGNYYGILGYYEGFDWEHREDPCYPAYYNYERFIRRNVIASNIGLIAKGEPRGELHVIATDLRTAQPLAGVELKLFNYQQQHLATTKTNEQGIGAFSFAKEAFVLVASHQGEKGYLKVQDGESLSLSRFDVAGVQQQEGMKGFFYGERGVWRPGDSVYLNFVLEFEDGKQPEGHPVTFELRDARGNLHTQLTTTRHSGPVYPFHFATRKDDPTGSWTATARVGGAAFTRYISVETIKPNRYKIKLDLGEEELRASDQSRQANLQVNWLHGAPAKNAAVKVEFQASSSQTTFPAFGDFVFDDPARTLETEPDLIFDRQVDQQGKASFTVPLDFHASVPGKLRLSFRTRAFEQGGGFSSDNFSLPYSPFQTYAGIRIPEDKYGSKRIDLEKGGEVELVAVDEKGSPVSGKKLSIGLYQVNWRWWWDRGDEYLAGFNSSEHLNALSTAMVTTDNKGLASWPVRVDGWGRYLLRVCDTESGHCTGDFFYAGYPWYGEDGNMSKQALAMLNFTADKESYQVGEEVNLTIPSGESGRCLISLETGGEVLQTIWTEVKKGENTFSFFTDHQMTPTVYAHVSLIQPHAQSNNDLPIRMYGVIPLEVIDPETRLAPVLSMPDELAPEQEFDVEIREENGHPMAYTLAIVDEGLLDLTRFKTPSPWDEFFAREALGVKTWDLYDQVLGAYGGQLQSILGIGGDGAVDPASAKESANRFKPVVMHVGPFYLNKGKKAVHRLKMPNYVGSVRVMLVAADPQAYGSVDKTVPVKKPLMVLATLPRVLSPGESLRLPVTVFAMDEKVKNVSLSVEESGDLVEWQGAPKANLQFTETGEKMAYFDLKVKEQTGVARFIIRASSGTEQAGQEIELEIRSPNPLVTEVTDKVIPAGEQWESVIDLPGLPGTNKVQMEVATIPPIELGRRLDYLIRYPYGCVEQTTSSGFPQLFVKQLIELSPERQRQVDQNIAATIQSLNRFQKSSGGFSYWPGDGNISDWGSSYAGHFLLEAKAKGYAVSQPVIDQWVRYQAKHARFWETRPSDRTYRYGDLVQAYRLYTLALAGKPEMGAMNRLRESKDLSLQGKWRLAAAYALAGRTEAAREMVAGLSTEVDAYTELGGAYGSAIRDQAMILETLTILGDKDKASRILLNLAKDLSRGQWYSTQTTAYALLAIGKFAGDSQVGEPFTFRYQLEGNDPVEAGSQKLLFQRSFDRPDQLQGKSLNLVNTSENQVFVRLIRSGKPLAGAETAVSEDLAMQVSYEDLEGNPLDVSLLSQGTDFYAEVTLRNPGTRGYAYEEMALEQIFPSGWEILNTRMTDISGPSGTTPEYQDVRDDRVYTFFDLGTTATFRLMLNAAYPGRYYLPAVQCSAMYDQSIVAREPGKWVEIVVPGEM